MVYRKIEAREFARMLYAIFSDIHANYAALRAAARDARAFAKREHYGQLEYISLGDVVDYGPQPNECVAWVGRNATIAVQGNHDLAAAEPLTSPPIEFAPQHLPILLWTRSALSEPNRQALRLWGERLGASPLRLAFTPFHSDIR
jgi:predicted phosphodiesterase